MKKLFLLPIVFLCGCAVIRIQNENTNTGPTTISAWVPAWPWQDSYQVASKLTASAQTNSFMGGATDVQQNQTTSTNLLDAAERMVGVAIGAAVKAAINPASKP